MLTPQSIGLVALVVFGLILLVVLVSVALRLIEMRSGIGLKEAKEFIEEFQRRSGVE
jgi:hypothetical protein